MAELIVKTYYDNLKKGKLMGLKCAKCGTHSFPPKGTCNKCGNPNLDWVQMSGEGKINVYSVLNYPGGELPGCRALCIRPCEDEGGPGLLHDGEGR